VLAAAWPRLPAAGLSWGWLFAVAAVAPATLILNTLEYVVAGRLLGHAVRTGEALRVTILSTAANLLPLPGAVLVRTQALSDLGSGYAGAFRSTGTVGIGWLATSFLAAGSLQAATGDPRLGSLLLGLGLLALAGAILLARRFPHWRRWLAAVVLLEGTFVVVSAARLLFALHALGVACSVPQAVVLTLASALASAAGVFPGGLGLRELLAGGLAALVAIPPAAGAVGAVLDRVVGLAVLSLAAGMVWALGGRSARVPGQGGSPQLVDP
jgi:hypothetical protein